MGDRANVRVTSKGSGEVYLYTHWCGTELPETVRRALSKNWRWDDAFYLCRIIFCEMVKDAVADETGFGISSRVGDGDQHVVHVDVDAQTVKLTGNPPMSFVEYCKSRRNWSE